MSAMAATISRRCLTAPAVSSAADSRSGMVSPCCTTAASNPHAVRASGDHEAASIAARSIECEGRPSKRQHICGRVPAGLVHGDTRSSGTCRPRGTTMCTSRAFPSAQADDAPTRSTRTAPPKGPPPAPRPAKRRHGQRPAVQDENALAHLTPSARPKVAVDRPIGYADPMELFARDDHVGLRAPTPRVRAVASSTSARPLIPPASTMVRPAMARVPGPVDEVVRTHGLWMRSAAELSAPVPAFAVLLLTTASANSCQRQDGTCSRLGLTGCARYQ